MRKALLFYKQTCKSCVPAKEFIEGLGGDPYFCVVETHDMDTDDGLALASYHGVILSPTILITEANDDDVVYKRYGGEVGEKTKESIIKELMVDAEET